jgi:hypothetical protein
VGADARLKFLTRPRDSAKSVIAVEFAHDFDDPIDRLEVRSRHGSVHRAVRHEQRFAEAADLKREELGQWLRHALRAALPNQIVHPLQRKTLARGDLSDRNAAIEEADDPRLTLAPFQARRSSRRNRPLAANGSPRRVLMESGFGISLIITRTNIEHNSPFGKKMSFSRIRSSFSPDRGMRAMARWRR